MPLYGAKEFAYAAPVADALVANRAFRAWVVSRTPFADRASRVRLLHEEMKARRSRQAATWWRSHFTESCRCPGCRGKETDLLAVFEDGAGRRFAIHFEVKQPTDIFKKGGDQAAAYARRAECWATPGRTPARVVPHQDATTALLCAGTMREASPESVKLFPSVFTFEEIAERFGVNFPVPVDGVATASRAMRR